LILPSHQLAFTLTMRLSVQLLEVCPCTRKVTAFAHLHLLSTTYLRSKPEFSGVHFSAEDASRSFSGQETPLKTHKYLPTHRDSGFLQTALSKALRN
jgi:hypothetical protein